MKIRETFKYILGGLIVIGFFVLMITLVLVDVSNSNEDLLYLSVGALIAAFSNIVGYFYGSSAGSQAKDEMMRNHKS